MNIDLRVTAKDDLLRVIDFPVDCISIGDEFCYHRLKTVDILKGMIDLCIKKKVKWRLVTAFMNSDACDEAFEKVIALSNAFGTFEIVINDYGFLQRISNSGKMKNFEIIAGQMLVHSIEEFLWVDEVVSKENEFMKRNWLLNSFINTVTINYFKEHYNLKGVELNMLPYTAASAEFLNENKVDVHYIDKYYTMAVSRKCHSTKNAGVQPSADCTSLCKKKYKINLVQTYEIGDPRKKYKNAPEELKKKVHDWIVFGNAIFREYDAYPDIRGQKQNSIILNYQFYNDHDEIKYRMQQY